MPKILWKPGHDGDEHIVELASSKDFSILGLAAMKLILEFDVTWKPPPQCSTKVQADLQIAFSLPRPFPRKLHAVRTHDRSNKINQMSDVLRDVLSADAFFCHGFLGVVSRSLRSLMLRCCSC